MLMFAYGSNLNLQQMARRCPNAVRLGPLALPDNKLVFRGVADCVASPGATCWGGVWRITAKDEEALDTYEGVRNGLYYKDYIPIKAMPDGERFMLVYRMYSTGIFPPAECYMDSIRQGYADFAMPKEAFTLLEGALHHSWAEKRPTHRERWRHRRKGRPALAQPEAPVTPEPAGKAQLELLPEAPKSPMKQKAKSLLPKRKARVVYTNLPPANSTGIKPNGARYWNATTKQWE